jgi:hypothetical protein
VVEIYTFTAKNVAVDGNCLFRSHAKPLNCANNCFLSSVYSNWGMFCTTAQKCEYKTITSRYAMCREHVETMVHMTNEEILR